YTPPAQTYTAPTAPYTPPVAPPAQPDVPQPTAAVSPALWPKADPAPAVAPAPAAPAPAASTAIYPAQQQQYAALKGDTMRTVAGKFYGDAEQWMPIYQANN